MQKRQDKRLRVVWGATGLHRLLFTGSLEQLHQLKTASFPVCWRFAAKNGVTEARILSSSEDNNQQCNTSFSFSYYISLSPSGILSSVLFF